MSQRGYVKTVRPTSSGRRAGGRGVAGATLRDDDYVTHILTTTAHAYLLFFSNRGRGVPAQGPRDPDPHGPGTAIVNLLPLQPDERIQAVIDTRDYETNRYLFFATRQGQVKKTGFNSTTRRCAAGLSPSTCGTTTSW